MLNMDPIKYCVGNIMSRTSVLYCKVDKLEVLNKDEVLGIIKDEIDEIDTELKKISNFIEKEGAKC